MRCMSGTCLSGFPGGCGSLYPMKNFFQSDTMRWAVLPLVVADHAEVAGVGGASPRPATDTDDDIAGEERTRGDGDGRVTAAERPSPPPALPPYPSTLPGQAPAAWAVPVRTLEYLNAHQLPVFLAANVATGVVNLSMRTIHTPHPAAFAILCVYATLVCGAAWAMSETISRSRSSTVKR
jgi:hypothetical protein